MASGVQELDNITMKAMLENTISFYGSHDSSVTFIDKNNRIRVIELERFVKKRYAAFSSSLSHRSFGITDEERRGFLEYIHRNVKCPDGIENILHMHLEDPDREMISKYFPKAKFTVMSHHHGHASCGHYQSGFEKSIIFSVDGGGYDHDGVIFTKCFLGDSDNINELESSPLDFGNPYSKIGYLISEIKKKEDDQLSWAGKIMGLCAYGKVIDDWIPSIVRFYTQESHSYEILKDILKVSEIKQDCLSGEMSYNLAATSQYVFEKLLFSWMKPLIDQYEDRDIVFVGGCALNVLYNQKLYEYIAANKSTKLYVPPNPNDCGLSLGFFLSNEKSIRGRDFVYDGIELLDQDKLDSYISERKAKRVSTEDIVRIIKRGEIIGLVFGDSEIGPRALGNRSIICDPSFENMKDILNKKVKFREWYRPFAPVSMLEDASLYFHNVFESKYMSYAPKVKEEYHNKLRSITHVDDTSRLQTVSNDGHSVFRDILNELKNQNHIPVILNTSFNIKGFPILTTIEDALFVLDNTELDHVIVEGYIFSKVNNNDRNI